MQQLKNGMMLLIVLAFLSSCRKDPPPSIEICILDGHGSGDCIEADGSKKFRLPSEMLNYWSTNQPDMKNWSSWCYQAGKAEVKQQMQMLYDQAKAPY